MISSVSGGGLANLALSNLPAVFVGQVSYSLYLWHWPPLALAQYLLFRPPNAWERTGLVAIAALGAYPHKVLCDWRVCAVERNGERLYFDDNHIDVAVNRLLELTVEAALEHLQNGTRLSRSTVKLAP